MEVNTEPGRLIMISSLTLEDLQQTNKRQAAEIKRLEGLVEGRAAEILRLSTELDEERQWRQELSDLSVDQQLEIERLKQALERLVGQWDPEGVRSRPDTGDEWRQAWWDARVVLGKA